MREIFHLGPGILCLILLTSLEALPAKAKEGFGASKLVVQLARVRPPDVYITGTRIAVRASGDGADRAAEQQLATALESRLLGNDSRLSRDGERPQTTVEITLLESSVNERWESRTESRLVKTGRDSRGKAVYETRYFQVRYKVISQILSVSYRVDDVLKQTTLDADNVVYSADNDYREGVDAPTPEQLEQSAITAAVQMISQRLSPTTETLGVLIPKGSLKELGNLAKAGLWDRYVEALESQPPRSNSKDESYRQYALGVAYEALGYAAEKPDIALSYLEQAALHYNAALAANPEEKHFVAGYQGSGLLSGLRGIVLRGPRGTGAASKAKSAMAPLDRVNTALTQYQKVADFQASDRERLVSLGGAKAIDEEGAGEVLDNSTIIEMTQAGLAEEIILTTVDTAERTEFDVSSKGLIELARAKVSTTIIQRLQAISDSKSP